MSARSVPKENDKRRGETRKPPRDCGLMCLRANARAHPCHELEPPTPVPDRVDRRCLVAFATPCWAAGPWLSDNRRRGHGHGRSRSRRDVARRERARRESRSDWRPVPAARSRRPPCHCNSISSFMAPTQRRPPRRTTRASARSRRCMRCIGMIDSPTESGRTAISACRSTSGNQWEGRRVIEKAGLTTFNIAPTVAWQATDRLSLGASIAAQVAEPEARFALSNDAMFYGPPVGLPDSQVELSGQSWATGGQLGLTYQATDGLRLGLAWTAPVNTRCRWTSPRRNLHPVLATPDAA